MLEPNVKDGAGGLRDLHALDLGRLDGGITGGLDGMVTAGAIELADVAVLEQANRRLLDVRVALHRVTSGRSDLLTLQEQDAVAQMLGMTNADALLRGLADAARQVGWISREAWARLESARQGPRGRVAHRDRPFGDYVVRARRARGLARRRAGDVTSVLELAAAAAETSSAIDRATLARIGTVDGHGRVGRTTDRAAFFRVLRAGRRCGGGLRGARSRRRARAPAARVGARACAPATERVPPFHRRPASARGRRRVRRDPR